MGISKRGLEALSKHKYQGQDDSILYYLFLNRWFNFAHRFVPEWVAPNVITLSGFAALLIDLLIIAYYSPHLYGDMPTWVYVFSGICLFFYQTMDNLDGKQARKTNSSSPLGELFDHGCDSLVVTLQAIVAAAIASMGTGTLALMYMFLLMLPFWLATWETYHTGILHLRIINGPEEGIVIVVFLFILSAFIGASGWLGGYKELLGITDFPLLPDMPFNRLVVILLVIPSAITSILNAYRVLNYIFKKGKPVWPAVQHIITFSFFFAGWLGWYLFSTNFTISLDPVVVDPNNLHDFESVWFSYPLLTRITVGIIFGEMVSRLILAHMLDEEYPMFPRPLKILLAALVYSTISYFLKRNYNQEIVLSELTILYAALFLSVLSYVHFARHTIQDFCSFLNISVLTIPFPSKCAPKQNTVKRTE